LAIVFPPVLNSCTRCRACIIIFSFDGHELRRPIDADWSPKVTGITAIFRFIPDCMPFIFPLKTGILRGNPMHTTLYIIQQFQAFFKLCQG